MDKNLKDHRELGQELDLFSFHDVAPGAVFWHHKGYLIYRTLQEFLRKNLLVEGYQEIFTPVMVKRELFEKSGHWNYYNENMFNLSVYSKEEFEEALNNFQKNFIVYLNKALPFLTADPNLKISPLMSDQIILTNGTIYYFNYTISEAIGNKGEYNFTFTPIPNYSLKPMNCPEACLVYQTQLRSYKDLPLRYADFGVLHRNELSGVLGGLFRVRQFSIDDAHHFVRPDQIENEIKTLLLFIKDFYKSLGFESEFFLSTKPDKAMGDPKLWVEAEKDLEKALKSAKVKYGKKEKDGAFYGPKIDIQIKDSQDRDWQLATIQLDFQIPEKMGLEYIDSDGKAKRPVIVHRAVTGSLERLIGILTEHFQGAFPLWLSPVQISLLTITEELDEYAKKIKAELLENGVRVETDLRNESLGAKIRNATLQKVPYLGIIGKKEMEDNSISLRSRDGKDLGKIKISDLKDKLKQEIDKKV